jgi:uncharacterized protein (DUF362 family)
VASLIWLLWRSGSQPRRLGYPCQQAAAANLGFLSILFVPALARRRRERRGSAWPKIAELATGSVALAGVLFILVSAGVEVYSDLTAAFSPGNPAIVGWTAVQPSASAVLSPRVLVPTDKESVVALNRNPAVTYGTQPYGPESDTAYDLVWQTVADLHLGPPDNPLRDLVADTNGDGVVRVLIKPNTVQYYSDSGTTDRNPVYVHPAMIRPLVDMAARAGAAQIHVGDGSDNTGALFTSRLDPMGYTQAYFDQMSAAWPGVAIARVDFHSPKRWSWCGLGTQAGGPSAWASSGYTVSQLQKAQDSSASSYFSAKDSHGRSGPGAASCMGWLALADELLDADVIIDLPKLKVHYLGVNTCAIKNWVGITTYSTFNSSNISGCRVSHNVAGADAYGMDFGNDSLWRELVDAHRNVLYRRGDAVYTTAQRRYLCVVDAINCAERYHVPSKPWHYWLHSVIAGVDPVGVDAVASRLQCYDFRRIPIVNNAHAVSVNSSWPLGTADPGKVRVVGGADINTAYSHLFAWETAQDPGMTWPDWTQAAVTDLQPPVINTATVNDLGNGAWQVLADISGGYAAYFYHGDAGNGAPNVLRLARSGNSYAATGTGARPSGLLVAQDAMFNTSRRVLTHQPMIEVGTGEFSHSVFCRQAVVDDTFTVRNVGPGTLDYTAGVSEGARSWLSVSPTGGSSAGEADTLAVHYAAAGLPPGTYTGTIEVADPLAYNPRESIRVSLVVTGYDADYDNDGDVDQEDFAHIQACLTGNLVTQADPACLDTRMDGDSDVDELDVSVFARCLGGPGIPADPCCAK